MFLILVNLINLCTRYRKGSWRHNTKHIYIIIIQIIHAKLWSKQVHFSQLPGLLKCLYRENERSQFMCVGEFDFFSISTTFQLHFETVPTERCIFLFFYFNTDTNYFCKFALVMDIANILFIWWLGELWCLMPLSTIFQL